VRLESCACRGYRVADGLEKATGFEIVDRVPDFPPFVSLPRHFQNQRIGRQVDWV